MEDYKKKYEQAMLRMNKWVEGSEIIDPKEVAEFVFPELKESEDEKIRKFIIKIFKDSQRDGISEVIMPEQYDKIFAWLEKQNKPQVRTGNEWVNIIDDACEHRYAEEYAHGEYCHQQSFRWGFQEGVDWLEKQGGITKLSEEEQNRFAKDVLSGCALSFINHLNAHAYEGKMCVSNGECEDIENAFHNTMWDRLHRYYCKYIEKQGEQKLLNNDKYQTVPVKILDRLYESEIELERLKQDEQKWSEEDEEMFDAIIADIQFTQKAHTYDDNQVVYEREIDWFKSLKNRVQPQPKPAWSGEDSCCYDDICEILINLIHSPKSNVNKDVVEKDLDWLKSLKERMKGE